MAPPAKPKGRTLVARAMADGPVQLLERLVDTRVTLLLKDARQLSGRLAGIDEHMNVVLEEASETTADVSRRLGRVVLRGSNVVTLHAADASVPKSR